jgi:predicted enzyme related to lactoylglutathione lyase
LRRLPESIPDLVTDQFDTLGSAADGCEVIVGANAHQYAVPSIAEHLDIRCVKAVYARVALPTPDLAPPPAPGGAADAATRASIVKPWCQTRRMWNERALEQINQSRERRGVAPIDDVLDVQPAAQQAVAAGGALARAGTPSRFGAKTDALPNARRSPSMPNLPSSNPSQFIQGAPVLLVPDVVTTATFYRDVLGFTLDFGDDDYSVVWRDNSAIHFAKDSGSPAGVRLFQWVRDVDAYYAEILTRGAKVESAPEDRPYGIRDFSLRDVNGIVVIFGQDIDEPMALT